MEFCDTLSSCDNNIDNDKVSSLFLKSKEICTLFQCMFTDLIGPRSVAKSLLVNGVEGDRVRIEKVADTTSPIPCHIQQSI